MLEFAGAIAVILVAIAFVAAGLLTVYGIVGDALGFWPEAILDLRECDIIETPIPQSDGNVVQFRRRVS